MKKVLVIDDDKDLCSLIKKYGEKEGYTFQFAYDGVSGLYKVQEEFHLIILDVMLPTINGISVLVEIRKESNVPVLMLTAKGDEADKVNGLRKGADDYLTKPFSMDELLARMDSLIRRYTKLNSPTAPIQLHDMLLDGDNRAAYKNGQLLDLTGKEFELLYFLASHRGRVFTKKQIYMHVWENDYAFDDSNIMSFISKLRKKIEPDPDNPFYIQTVRGIGYRLNQKASS